MPKCKILELLGSSNQVVQNMFNQANNLRSFLSFTEQNDVEHDTLACSVQTGGGWQIGNNAMLKFLKANGEIKATRKPLSNLFGSGKSILKEELDELFDKVRDSFNSEKYVNVIKQALKVFKFETHVMDLMWDVEKLGGGTAVEMSQADITKRWENGTKSPISALQALTEILSWDANYRADHKDKLVQTVEDLCKHVMEGKIDENLYTEENLILLNDIFDMCCMENDSSDITDVMQYISDYWYQMVRKINSAKRKTLADGKEDFNEEPQAKRPRKMRTDLDN